jgi:ubiquinone/menaquinone biosynthesis C-methylase UbiE
MSRADVWAAGELYEPYVGRWSRLVAREFVAGLAIPEGREWLDVGCGTGALTQAILAASKPRRVMGIDPSPGFIEYGRAHTRDPRASFAVGDAQALTVESASVDAVVSGLVLNFVPNPVRALSEMARSCAAGRNARRLCVGLRRQDGAHALLLGRRRRARSQGRRPR